MKNKKYILNAAIITTGLSAGIFYAFSVAINPAFSKTSDQTYIQGMQSINDKIQNPVFFATFFGAAILLPVAAWAYHKSPKGKQFQFLALATLLYWMGPIIVTLSQNVPLNEALAQVNTTTASTTQLREQRSAYSEPWNKWHTVRTVLAVGALAAVAAAALKNPDKND